jgi:hypothetical protein
MEAKFPAGVSEAGIFMTNFIFINDLNRCVRIARSSKQLDSGDFSRVKEEPSRVRIWITW